MNSHFYYAPVNCVAPTECLDSSVNLIVCPNGCGQKFKNVGGVNRHLRYACGAPPKFICSMCQKAYSRKDNLKTHMILKHGVFLEPAKINYR